MAAGNINVFCFQVASLETMKQRTAHERWFSVSSTYTKLVQAVCQLPAAGCYADGDLCHHAGKFYQKVKGGTRSCRPEAG